MPVSVPQKHLFFTLKFDLNFHTTTFSKAHYFNLLLALIYLILLFREIFHGKIIFSLTKESSKMLVFLRYSWSTHANHLERSEFKAFVILTSAHTAFSQLISKLRTNAPLHFSIALETDTVLMNFLVAYILL